MRQRSSPRKDRTRRSKRTKTANPSPTVASSEFHSVTPIARGGVACPFPWRLHEMLDFVHSNELEDVVSWDSKGAAFSVNNVPVFVKTILPQFFSQSKYASFQRQLNLYGFSRKRCNKYSAYYHDFFIRGQPDLVRNMTRCKVKGTGKKRVESQSCTTPPTRALPAPITPRSGEVTSVDIYQNMVESPEVDDNDSFALDGIVHSSDEGEDILFFEGRPFHFLEPETYESSPTTVAIPLPVLSSSSRRTTTRLAPRMRSVSYLPSEFDDFKL